MKRVTVTYSGRVQGVGFRYSTVRLAEPYVELTGYVANQPDGTVLLVVEGEKESVRSLLGDIRQSGLDRYITDTQADWGPATGEFKDFRVRYR